MSQSGLRLLSDKESRGEHFETQGRRYLQRKESAALLQLDAKEDRKDLTFVSVRKQKEGQLVPKELINYHEPGAKDQTTPL